MKRLTILSFVFILILAASCSKKSNPGPPPIATFSYSIQSPVPPATVNFSNTSQNATSYNWDFGDNSTSTVTSPTHSYSQDGNYTVTLIAKGSGGSNQSQQIVNIGAKSMTIVSVSIDNVVEITNPMSFSETIKIGNDAPVYLPFYPLPISSVAVFPAGIWSNLNFQADLKTPITLSTFFIIPFDPTVYLVPNSNFTFFPKDFSSGANPYPSTINFVQDAGTLSETRISLKVSWQ